MSVEIEHVTKVIPIDSELPNELKRLESEGYSLAPGVVPVAIYNLVRAKKADAQGGLGVIKIDDSKVSVLRDGKLIPLDQL